MNVLFIASECTPFIKTGGLADVIGSLPSSLKNTGVNVSIMLPNYSDIPEEYKDQMTLIKTLTVHVGWRKQYCGLLQLVHKGITYYFIDNEYYFKRKGLYGHYDDGERFAFFNHAVIDCLPYLDEKPQVLHCHDWQTGLIPAYIKTMYTYRPFYRELKTVFTIHNLMYQGIYSASIFHDLLNFSDEHFFGIEYNGCINFMKAGLFHSDVLTTVSETYSKEIQYPYFGEKLEDMLIYRKDDLHGIVNGVDYDEYNPETDPYIYKNYSQSPIEKMVNKRLLQEELGLPKVDEVPMVAIVSRFVEQKGFPLIRHVLDELLSLDIQLVILGTGDVEFEHAFEEAAYRFPNKVSTNIKFSEPLARKIYAASDLFLMPSRFEPCGIGQLIALRYESVPIVRETGGLKDTIQPYDEFSYSGNGFSFTNYNAHDMLYTIKRAISFYNDKEHWSQLLKNVYQSNYSWEQSAKRYTDLYKKTLKV
ncbi:glycogen synthase GlgA [Alkalihalobacterium elongatum]|uniref:glycogen synthase GlgA n=1 Tax=Alkalihalobacterium elongatum TaxID=2675466 RepID=UPI001C1F785F|nr:glycogen synthase GlgA [Alkalihalobacterium elongatum]